MKKICILLCVLAIPTFTTEISGGMVGGKPGRDREHHDPSARDSCPLINSCLGAVYFIGGLAWDGEYLWGGEFNYGGAPLLYQINPDCGIVGSIPAPGESIGGLAWDGSALWCLDEDEARIFQVSPADGSILHEIPSPSYGEEDPNDGGLAWDGSYLWTATYTEGLIFQIDPGSGAIQREYLMPTDNPSGVGYGGGVLVVSDSTADLIYEVDPANGDVLSVCTAPSTHPWGVAVFEDVWHTDGDTGRLYLLDFDFHPSTESSTWSLIKATYR